MKYYKLLLVSIFIIAAFTRFYNLSILPPGLHPDEAANGLDIIRMIDNNDFRTLYNTNGPREALFFYLQGIFVLLFGFTSFALRIAPALIGVLTILGLYLLVKEWLDKNYGLLASFFLAISSWHIQFSRNGFRAIMVPLILVFLLYFLTKTVREKKLIYFILSGVFFSLGFYTYLAYLMILPMGLFFIIYLWFTKKMEFKNFLENNWKKILIAILAAFIIYLPLLMYYVKNPSDFLARSTGVSILNSDSSSPIVLLTKNAIKALSMFNIKGDINFRHNYASLPMLDPFLGAFFIMGALITLFRLKKTEYFFLFIWFGFMLAPTILSAEGIPHALRAVGTIPIAYIFSIIGIKAFYESFVKYDRKKMALVFLTLVIIAGTTFNLTKYFAWWANDPVTFAAYDYDISNMAEFMKNLPKNVEKYAIIFGYSNHSLAFLTHDNKDRSIKGLYGISGDYYVIDQIYKIEAINPKSNRYVFAIQKDMFDDAKYELPRFFPDGKFFKRDGFFYYTNINL